MDFAKYGLHHTAKAWCTLLVTPCSTLSSLKNSASLGNKLYLLQVLQCQSYASGTGRSPPFQAPWIDKFMASAYSIHVLVQIRCYLSQVPNKRNHIHILVKHRCGLRFIHSHTWALGVGGITCPSQGQGQGFESPSVQVFFAVSDLILRCNCCLKFDTYSQTNNFSTYLFRFEG